IGEKTLTATIPANADGAVTVALRPEDLVVVSDTYSGVNEAWKARVDQVMDLGHYRKLLVDVPQIGELKIFVSKSMHLNEGDTISLAPMRYLIYFGDKAPIEVNHLPKQESVVITSSSDL
ncbi:MAG: TOBE domain-containing protein, partial [Chloroflexota bacterium]